MSKFGRFVLALAIVNAAWSSIAFATPSTVHVVSDRIYFGRYDISHIGCIDLCGGKSTLVEVPIQFRAAAITWHSTDGIGNAWTFGEPGLDDAHLYIRSQRDLVRFAIPAPQQITETAGPTEESVRLVEATPAAVTSRVAEATQPTQNERTLRVMTFNILQGGEEAKNVGFDDSLFGGSRFDELAAVIHLAKADVVGVQEDCDSEKLLQALGAGWRRIGSVYARSEMRKVSVEPYLTVVELSLFSGQKATLVNCHWFPPRGGYGPDLAQSELRANPRLDDLAVAAKRITEKCAVPHGPRGYNATLKPIRESLAAGETVLLTGDFNEPSHLDWTARYAQSGSDRWVHNPTGTPLRFAVPWPGSRALEDAGMIDSFRAVHSDEVKTPGATWTPKYPEKTPGRRPYGEQCLDRIDRIYHAGSHLVPRTARVIGESTPPADIPFPARWPSDHRAVVIEFIEM